MQHKSYMFWINVIAIVLGAGLLIFLLVKPKEKAPDPTPTEPITPKSVATEQTPTESQDNTQKPIASQTDYPKIEEIKYGYAFAEYPHQSAVLMWYQNDSKYTVTSVQFHFKTKAQSPCFVNERVCDPGETADPVPCTLFDNTYLPSVSPSDLDQVHIAFQGNDGRIYTVVYSVQDNTHTLQKEAQPAKTWTQKGFTKVTPMPDTRFITVNRDNSDYYQFTAYDMTFEQYREYCSQCQTAGFTKDVADNDFSFTCTDERGLTLNILYHSEKQGVVVTATSGTEGKNEELDKPVDAPTATVEEMMSWYVPNLSGPVEEYLQVDSSRTVIYRVEYTKYDTVIPIYLPILEPFSDDAVACQAEIEADLKKAFDEITEAVAAQRQRPISRITFDATVHKDILSIIVNRGGNYGGYYYVYNLDVATGKRLSNEALAEKCGITDLEEALIRSARAVYESKWEHRIDNEYYTERLNATIDPKNIAQAKLYLDQDGKLKAVMYIGALVGGATYLEHIPVS